VSLNIPQKEERKERLILEEMRIYRMSTPTGLSIGFKQAYDLVRGDLTIRYNVLKFGI
jgi:hypothetical protein